MPAFPRRKLGIEPLDVDLVVGPSSLTPADRAEIDVFFRKLRARNDCKPAVLAIRRQLARKNPRS